MVSRSRRFTLAATLRVSCSVRAAVTVTVSEKVAGVSTTSMFCSRRSGGQRLPMLAESLGADDQDEIAGARQRGARTGRPGR